MTTRPGEVSATFEIQAPAREGERVYIVGSTPGRGAWQPALGAPAHFDAGRWHAVVELPAHGDVEYAAYLLTSDGTWRQETGGRRRLKVPGAGPLDVARAASFAASPVP